MSRAWYERLYEYFPNYDNEPYVKNTTAEVDFILQETQISPGAAILDVGCGTGRHSLELARRGFSATGIDLSSYLISLAKSHAREEHLSCRFRVEDARELHILEKFDLAIMLCEGGFSLMEEDEMDTAILENIYRSLKPAGEIIFTAPNAAFMLRHGSNEQAFDVQTLRERFSMDHETMNGKSEQLDCTQRYYTIPEINRILTSIGFINISSFAVTDRGFTRNVPVSADHFEFGITAYKPYKEEQ